MEQITVRHEYQISANEIMKLHRLSRTNDYYRKAYNFLMQVLDDKYEKMTYNQRNYIMSILDDIR